MAWRFQIMKGTKSSKIILQLELKLLRLKWSYVIKVRCYNVELEKLNGHIYFLSIKSHSKGWPNGTGSLKNSCWKHIWKLENIPFHGFILWVEPLLHGGLARSWILILTILLLVLFSYMLFPHSWREYINKEDRKTGCQKLQLISNLYLHCVNVVNFLISPHSRNFVHKPNGRWEVFSY